MELALRGGYPEPVLRLSPDIARAWLQGYIDQLLTRDGAALDLDATTILRDGDLLGRVLESLVLAQIRPEAHLAAVAPRLHHVRDRDGRHEIDLLAEPPGGDVVSIEVKATAAPTATDARHLAWLRDRIGDRFRAGAVLHTGPRAYVLGERILALPICVLWD